MIQVLAVSDSAEFMGTEHSLLNLASALPEHGAIMTLAARPGGSLQRRWCEAGLAFLNLNVDERQGFRPNSGEGHHGVAKLARLPLQTARATTNVARLIADQPADVLHSNSLMTHVDCALAGRLTRTRTVLELHEIVAPGIGRLAMGAAVRASGNAIAISNAVRDQIPRWARNLAAVVPQGVDPRRFDEKGQSTVWRNRLTASPCAPLVAAVGRIDPEKGLDVLIDAVARVRRGGLDLHLVLVGSPSKDDGTYLSRLMYIGGELLGEAFRVIPQVDDVSELLFAVDILACPSTAEPFGLILLEAQMCSVVVVACAAGGPPDFITDDETGVLVAPSSASALAAALERLVIDPDRRKRLACAGKARARRTYTVDIRAQKVAALYRQITGL